MINYIPLTIGEFIANWGIASSTAIIDVVTYGQYLKYDTRIVTAYCPQL